MLLSTRSVCFALALVLGHAPASAACASLLTPPRPEAGDQAGVASDETPDLPKPKLALGYLSDPETPPKDFLEALFTGKVHLDNRLRIELADTTGSDSSTAITNRIRLGYETKPFHGFSGFIEMENVASPDEGNYFVPATGGGTGSRTVVADPTGTEVNQAYARFQTDALSDSNVSLDLKAGRQRITIDDSRFVGNVGWRQFEQTYDAVRLQSNLGIDDLSIQYAYVWHVQRIFGPDGPDWDSDSHLINASYTPIPELSVTPFVYLLDFKGDSPLNSVNTYGVRLSGDLWKNADEESNIYFDYELTYAHQTDGGSNTVDFETDFFAAQARITNKGFGSATLGFQFLGSDNGTFAFRFPLGTNHKFQGFADTFLVTPATGLQDLYITGSLDLPYGIKSSATLHQFWSDEGGMDLGHEIDLVASKNITANWSVLVKAAFFDGHGGMPDTTRVWLQTVFHF